MKLNIFLRMLICVAIFSFITFLGVASAISDNRKINEDLALLLKEPVSSASYPQTASSPTVNINTATSDELCTLEGIGEIKAKAIIEYREHNGGFIEKEEIMRVKGIGEGTYRKIKDYIYV